MFAGFQRKTGPVGVCVVADPRGSSPNSLKTLLPAGGAPAVRNHGNPIGPNSLKAGPRLVALG